MIVNNMHNGSQAVREEAARFMMTVCGDETDLKSLMPIQSIPATTSEDATDFAVNFYSEPNKSKKQLLKVTQLIDKHLVSRKDYILMIKQSAPDLVIFEKQPNSLLAAESNMSLAEERARLLVYVFGKITSVVFDINSL